MDELLPHYERELAFLRAHAGEFAKRYPKIAGRLQLSGDVGEDPHVERLIESFALLSSRIHKRLDDDFPLFTETFLDVLYPHYLRPFPSCSIARFDVGGGAAQMSAVRRSCQTMALWMGWPVWRFHTTVVSRWLVMPMAATSRACRPAVASTSRAVASWVSHSSFGSCSTPPGRG